jgi:cellulose synthase/poly-beta-1,6-N-acetylglucosamine synthase-like glycosyltransferase
VSKLFTDKHLSFSIVIPTYNEEDYISRCIESIINQNYKLELIEIIIVDGLSTDNTVPLIKEFQKQFHQIKLVDNPKMRTPISLNLGVRESSGEVIVILGAHTSLDKDFIFYNNKYLNELEVKITGGTQINRGLNFIQRAIGLAMENPFAMASAPYRWSSKEQFVDTVVYAAYKRELFDEIGFFEEDFTISEDAEFNWRLRKAGYNIFFSPKIKSYYYPRKNVKKFVQQMFRYGILRVNVLKKHLSAFKISHIIPPLFVISLLILVFLTFTSYLSPIYLFLFFAVYLLVNILSTFLRLSYQKFYYISVIPVIIFLMHFAWGLGFIVGFILPKSKKW